MPGFRFSLKSTLIFFACTTVLLVSGTAFAGDEESPLNEQGWHYCKDVNATNWDPKQTNGEAVTITVDIESFVNRTTSVLVLAGYIDSVSQKIGWASGRERYDIGPKATGRVRVHSSAAPFAKSIAVRVFCR